MVIPHEKPARVAQTRRYVDSNQGMPQYKSRTEDRTPAR